MKKIFSVDELINHMKEKGIRFDETSIEDAINFLHYNNYYFKLAAYRNLYPKIVQGKRKGEYQNLDFAYLQELSTIDMHIRYLIIEMCLDIEHAIKVRLVDAVTNNQFEDGYEIVRRYLNEEDKNFYLLKTIKKHKSGEYCGNLIDKYYPYFPIWALVEVISFGDLLHICQFYERKYNCQIIPKNKFMNTVRDLRNASAHSNCLLNQLNQRMESSKQPDSEITKFVKNIGTISNQTRNNNLHKNFAYDITVLLYVYDWLMPSIAKKKRYAQLYFFMKGRAKKKASYFSTNSQISGCYVFLRKIIDNLNSKY